MGDTHRFEACFCQVKKMPKDSRFVQLSPVFYKNRIQLIEKHQNIELTPAWLFGLFSASDECKKNFLTRSVSFILTAALTSYDQAKSRIQTSGRRAAQPAAVGLRLDNLETLDH